MEMTDQIYNVRILKRTLGLYKRNIRKINLSSSPFRINKIANKFFKIKLHKNKNFRTINMKSIYGSQKGYFFSTKKCFEDLKNFLKKKNKK